MEIYITKDRVKAQEERPFEFVERKGSGHPDTICDAISESLSRYYAQYCFNRFGRFAHHWFDKVMIVGGAADVDYERGVIIKPAKVICAGKCAYRVGDEHIPVETLARAAIEQVLAESLVGFDPRTHYELSLELVDSLGAGRASSRYRPMSINELADIQVPPRAVSNDANFLVGFAPYSQLEKLVLGVERYINSSDFKTRNPDSGTDVKVFGRRRGREFDLLINMPFLARHIESLEHYYSRKQAVQADIARFCKDSFGIAPKLMMNATDRNGRPYLTALGSVLDTGDVGVTGRGNRVTGLITPMRPMSIEAPAGKNPLDHTGKLYSILAQRVAEAIHKAVNCPVEVYIFTAKETPLGSPDRIEVVLDHESPNSVNIEQIVRAHLSAIPALQQELIFDGVYLW
jgi:S-adenosylmethionine synthetase